MQIQCAAGNGEAVDALLESIDAGREKRRLQAAADSQNGKTTRVMQRIARSATATKKPCNTCGGENKPRVSASRERVGVMATAVHRLASLKNAAVDFVQDGMHIATDEQQQSRLAICSACPVFKDGWCKLSLKVMARAAYCPQGKWFAGGDNPRPVEKPVRSLAFHLYAKKRAEWNWYWHIDQIKKHAPVFNGKIVIGVTHEPGQDIEAVKSLFDGVPVDGWVIKQNTKLAETLTHVEIFDQLQTDDPNALIFRYHTKGVTKRQNSVEQRWAEIMWAANMDLASVDAALTDHMTCGVLRSHKPLVSTKPSGNFFFAGSAYWMRAKEVFERDWRHTDATRWWVEYFPSHLFSLSESACLFHDQTDSPVLSQAYFDNYVEPEYSQWKFARGLE